MNVNDISGKISALQTELKGVFEKHRSADGFDIPSDVLSTIESREAELKSLNDDLARAKSVEKLAKANSEYHENEGKIHRLPVEAKSFQVEQKSLGRLFMDSKAHKLGGAPVTINDYDVKGELGFKTNFSTSAGWAPANVRSDLVVMSAQRPITLLDYLPSQTVSVGQSGFRYMLETTFTNNAAELAEAGTYAEGALALTEQVVNIRKIGSTIPVTDEQLEDVDGVSDYLTRRLTLMLRTRLENQIVAGNGSAPNILGLNGFSGVLTQARSTDDHYSAIFKAITKIRAQGFTEPNLIVMHPTDWQTIRLAQATTGQFIWDSPAVAGSSTMFGLPVIVSAVMTQGTAYVMDTNFVSILYRHGIEFSSTNAHASEFLSGVQRIRADVRAAVMLERGPALCTVTGL